MKEYLKIETIYQRDMEGSKKLLDGVFRNPTVDFLKDNQWTWTEKVNGTNIRIHWDGHKVEFGGRTDKAQIPAPLVNKLNEYFGGETNAQLFEQTFGEKEVILFGEGYGAKIQSGGDYTDDGKSVDFIMFDIMIGDNYQPRVTVVEIANTFGVSVVPIVGEGTLENAVRYVKEHKLSKLGPMKHEMEGIVCRPAVELQDRCGNRLIVKIKWEDFKYLV
jgi:ATP-dependent RNA circularization protein (DNA/RNA ligase family)